VTDDALLVVLCTVPAERARAFARSIVEAQLAACVNVLPPMRSIYRWQGEVSDDEECQLVIKTTADRWEALSTFVRAGHGYDVPELIAVDVTRALPEYAAWLRDATRVGG
jgi:periplasmic divalent cation tolerance protein